MSFYWGLLACIPCYLVFYIFWYSRPKDRPCTVTQNIFNDIQKKTTHNNEDTKSLKPKQAHLLTPTESIDHDIHHNLPNNPDEDDIDSMERSYIEPSYVHKVSDIRVIGEQFLSLLNGISQTKLNVVKSHSDDEDDDGQHTPVNMTPIPAGDHNDVDYSQNTITFGVQTSSMMGGGFVLSYSNKPISPVTMQSNTLSFNSGTPSTNINYNTC